MDLSYHILTCESTNPAYQKCILDNRTKTRTVFLQFDEPTKFLSFQAVFPLISDLIHYNIDLFPVHEMRKN